MRAALAAIPAFLLAACATAPPVPREAGAEQFVIEQDLIGRTTARGEFRAINGARRGFTAELNGSFDGQTFTLVEDFAYDDGETDQKTWRLTRVGEGEYRGVREDVVGEARGFQDGNVFRLEYDIRLPNEDGSPGRKLRFRDVMAETPDGVVINRATVGLYGFRVGGVDLRITRPQGE